MKVKAWCTLDTKTVIKDFYFDDDADIITIDNKINKWVRETVKTGWTKVKEEENDYE